MEQKNGIGKPPERAANTSDAAYQRSIDAVLVAVSQKINSDGSLAPKLIRALFKVQSVRVSDLARAWGCTETLVHKVVNGRDKNLQRRVLIADALQMPYEAIWGLALAKGRGHEEPEKRAAVGA